MKLANTSLRRKLYQLLEPSAWPRQGLSPLNKCIAALICAAALLAILESEPTLYQGREGMFFGLAAAVTGVFIVEYVARLWVAGENEMYRGVLGRLRFATTPTVVIDLLAILPMFLLFLGSEAFLLRLVRMVRIFRVARLGRFSQAINAIGSALQARRFELLMTLGIALVVMLVSSTLLYIVEGSSQPATFGSIPRAMWWSVITLTTVGYGDASPVTALGQILAGVTAVAGIGLIAMPTGILASAFSDVIQKQQQEKPGSERSRGR